MAEHAELALVQRGGVAVRSLPREDGGLTGELAWQQHPDELLGAVGREPEDLKASCVQHHELRHIVVGGVGRLASMQVGLSLIHISEPTRRTPISYAVFCLKKK